ncbi:MAG: hypothetical protein AAF846_10975 [Chloroflexota bacterium]
MSRFLTSLVACLLSVSIAVAQFSDCSPYLMTALESVQTYCDELGRNQVCYGNTLVEATFSSEAPATFAFPADIVDVTNLNTLQPSPYSDNPHQWGIALFNLQADFPQTLPGQSVIMLALGNVGLDNQVMPENAITYDQTMTVVTTVSSNLRASPDITASIMDGVPANTQLIVYGTDATQSWLRLEQAGLPLWISRSVVQTDDNLDDLPIITGGINSTMQTFRLSSGMGAPQCQEVTDAVIIQSPEGSQTELFINDEQIVVGSTVVLTVDDTLMTLYVLDGRAIVGEDVGLAEGYAMQIDLIEDDEAKVTSTGDWYGFRPMTATDIDNLEYLINVPETILHYPITMPDLVNPTTTTGNTSNNGSQSQSTNDNSSPAQDDTRNDNSDDDDDDSDDNDGDSDDDDSDDDD